MCSSSGAGAVSRAPLPVPLGWRQLAHRPAPVSIRRLYQALGDRQVVDVSPVHVFPAVWKNPWSADRRSINAIGFDPEDDLLAAPTRRHGGRVRTPP